MADDVLELMFAIFAAFNKHAALMNVFKTIMTINSIIAIIQAMCIIKNFSFTFIVFHGWELALNLMGTSFMALFLCKQDIFLPLANFKERHCWNSKAMGSKIQKEIKDDARRKFAMFVISSLTALGTNILAGIFYKNALQQEYLVLKMARNYFQLHAIYPVWVALTMGNTLGGLSAYYFFYFAFHLKYQICMFKGFLKYASEKLDRPSLSQIRYQQEVRKVLTAVIKRHVLLKQWGLLMMKPGQIILMMYIVFGGFLTICNCLAVLFIPDIRILFATLIVITVSYIHMMAQFGQHFEDIFDELYVTTLLCFPWHKWNPSNRSLYLVMIQNMQKPVKLEIPRLVSLNYANEVWLIKALYTAGGMVLSLANRHHTQNNFKMM